MLIIGAHMSISSGFLNAVKKTVECYNSNALQIFLKSPQSFHSVILQTKKQQKRKNI